VVCRQLVATTSRAGTCTTLLDPTRSRTIRTCASAYLIARSTACSCACSIAALSSGAASAHAALTDFGAENVASIAATASPDAPTRRSGSVVPGRRTSISALSCSRLTRRFASAPTAAAPPTQRPGVSTLSPSLR
jgi:hypothetical protein